ncbi:MAG: UvrD-helicase domain-containing protein [Candidatus Korobacteraceae bacterium]|jgi:DNA helicase-2/ATP-dependent DNA helicase PcrA
MDFLSKLNPQQREAVETVHGPVLILAGAGSGKTRVITYRIAYLVEHENVAADRILAVTFTNKAASEMAERVTQLIGQRSFARPAISTFHSFCVRMLRRDIEVLQVNGKGYTRDFVIYDEADQQQVVKSAIRRLGIDDKKLTPRAVLGLISSAKNHMQDPQEMYLNSAEPKMERIAHIYKIYKDELLKANALDFDDLLLESVRLLKGDAATREKYQRRFQYMLVDEYQDTNRPQYEIMCALAGSQHNLCAVGDEDQSIYSWRGADINNILDFEKNFPEAKIIRLEENYRSTQPILQAASAVVANNVQRKGKNLWTAREGGSKIGFYDAPDGENEALFAADFIARWAQARAREGADTRAAILYRTNAQSRLLEEALRRYNLNYNVVGGFSFYERAEIKDMISYLKLILNPDDSVALMRVVNTPVRGIGKSTMETVERVALETNRSLWSALGEVIERRLLSARACAALVGFRDLISEARTLVHGEFAERTEDAALPEPTAAPSAASPAALAAAEPEAAPDAQHGFDFGYLAPAAGSEALPDADESFDVSQLSETLDGDATEFTPGADAAEFSPDELHEETSAPEAPPQPEEKVSTAEVLKFLIDRTKYIQLLEAEDSPDAQARIENLRELVNAALDSRDRGESISDFLDHAALVSDVDQYDDSQQITLMTLHSAKGLEFPLIFLVGMEEGLFPHSRTLLAPAEIEEERRLCYVGMTRAMDTLILSRARERRRYGTDAAQTSVPSRFLEEIPIELLEDAGSPGKIKGSTPHFQEYGLTHYDYENEDQSAGWGGRSRQKSAPRNSYTGQAYNSIDNIAEFFASRGKKFSRPEMELDKPSAGRGLRKGDRVRHPKYGEGVVYHREGDGEDTKITVQFHSFGLKKLVEKYAQLVKA